MEKLKSEILEEELQNVRSIELVEIMPSAVYSLVQDFFKDDNKFISWMYSKSAGLYGKRPIDIGYYEENWERVEEVINSLKHGIQL